MPELQRLKEMLDGMISYEQDLNDRIQQRRRDDDSKWAVWMDTPEAIIEIIKNPDLAIRPSQRVYSGAQILEMIRNRK